MKDVVVNEIRRKAFHLTAVVFPFFLFVLPLRGFVRFMLFSTAIVLVIDYTKVWVKFLNYKWFSNFKNSLREIDTVKGKLTGSSYIFISVLFLSVFSRKIEITVLSFLVLVFCDSAAAVGGISFGSHRFEKLGKSIEGTVFFIATGVVFISLFSIIFHIPFLHLFLALFASAMVELFSNKLKINDNLSIPIVFSFIYYLVNICF